MTFGQWWKENERELSARYYRDMRWTGAYHMFRTAYEAGEASRPVVESPQSSPSLVRRFYLWWARIWNRDVL